MFETIISQYYIYIYNISHTEQHFFEEFSLQYSNFVQFCQVKSAFKLLSCLTSLDESQKGFCDSTRRQNIS